MNNIEDLLKKNITPDFVPEDDLNTSILKQAKEIDIMKHRPFKSSAAAAAVIAILTIGSGTVYAAYHFLTAPQVADSLTGSSSLAEAFEGDDAVLVNESQSTAGYQVTFLGTVTGKNLIPEVEDTDRAEDLIPDRTYAVVAIEHSDGSPMPSVADPDYKTFCVSPFIHGKTFEEVNNGILNAGVASFVQDGVQYELLECDDLEIFSGMGVSLGVVESFGEETTAFDYDADTGIYHINSDYDGMNALFELPLDRAKADERAAEAYLNNAQAAEDEDTDTLTGNQEIDGWVKAISDAHDSTNEAWQAAMANAKSDDTKTQVSEVDKDGYIVYHTQDNESENQIWVADWPYDAGVEVINGAESDGTMEGTDVSTITLNEDGTFTIRYYVPLD